MNRRLLGFHGLPTISPPLTDPRFAQGPRMDSNRLKEVQQTDISESRVNEDFVDWLKNKGPTWLLVIMVILCAWVGWDRIKSMRVQKLDQARMELSDAFSPVDLQRIASDYASVREEALLRAADLYLQSVQTGRTIASSLTPSELPPELTADERAMAITEGRRLYNELLDATKGDAGKVLFAVNAQFGLAALAESAGEFDTAREHYTQAANLARDQFNMLASQAEQRRDALSALPKEIVLIERTALPRPEIIDPLLRDLIQVPDAEESATDGSAGEGTD